MVQEICRIEIQKLLNEKKGGFTGKDKEDLEGEIKNQLLRNLGNYKPEKSSVKTFINLIARTKLLTLVSAQHKGKRNYQLLAHSLNELVESEDGSWIEKIDLVSNKGHISKTSQITEHLPQNELDFVIHVKTILSDFSSLRKETFKILINGGTEKDIMQELGVTRAMARTLKKDVQKLFRDNF